MREERSTFRHTRQRQLTLQVLRQTPSHPTARELHTRLRRIMPRISLGTVYRNVEVLARQGAIRKLVAGGTEARFDGNTGPHQHIRCIRCGRVDDADLPALRPSTLGLAAGQNSEVSGYEVLGFTLDLLGVCPRCRIQTGIPRSEFPAPEATSSVNPAENIAALPFRSRPGATGGTDKKTIGDKNDDGACERDNLQG